MAVINGTSRGDSLTGGSEDDLIRGYGGFDTLYGNNGNDTQVFSNTEMSLKVGGSRSDRRSWEVSEWKGDVEGHEGPVQALSGPLLGC